MTVIVVCGGRFYTDKQRVFDTLDKMYSNSIDTFVVVEGGSSYGADSFARQWVRRRKLEGKNVECITVKANWKLYGKAAGPIRNQQMIDDYRPEKVLAFPGHKGTKDMIARARKAGIPVILSEDWDDEVRAALL
ncbi:MAG: DUF2493 domain-containing protein [Clostridia bacterium]